MVDCFFLDLFAGSGAVGIEALSRGAKQAIFVELNRKNVAVIRENLAATGFSKQVKVYALDVIRALNKLAQSGQKFDIIFIGAPYDSPALEKVMYKLGDAGFLTEAGLVIAEHRKQQKLLEEYGELKLFREARYGETTLKFYENSNISR